MPDGGSQNAGRAARRKNQPHEQLQRGRFAGAVRAQKTKNLMRLDSERQPIKRAHLTLAPETNFVVLGQVVDFNYRHTFGLEFRLQSVQSKESRLGGTPNSLLKRDLRIDIQSYIAPILN